MASKAKTTKGARKAPATATPATASTPNLLAGTLAARPTSAPINKAMPTKGIAYGYATALVWLVAHNVAQGGAKVTTSAVYQALGGQAGVAHTAVPVVALKAGYTGNVHVNWHTVNTQVGRYNLWASGVGSVKPPRGFVP